MIARIDKSGINLELDDDVVKYIDRKIGRLDRYIPRTARSSAHATVTIRDTGNQAGNKYECEVIIRVPGETVTAKESTMNKFAAVDIVEAKLRNQLHKYKTTHMSSAKVGRGLLRRVRARVFPGSTEKVDV
jgi:ribosomal subunit interface protein